MWRLVKMPEQTVKLNTLWPLVHMPAAIIKAKIPLPLVIKLDIPCNNVVWPLVIKLAQAVYCIEV